MRVVTINTTDYGGAGIAAINLHLGLLELGIDAHLLTLEKKRKDIPNHHQYFPKPSAPPSVSLMQRIYKRILRQFKSAEESTEVPRWKQIANPPQGFELFSFSDSLFDIMDSELVQSADIIHFHWVAFFVNLETFFSVNNKPVVWTLHDMVGFTGGCHYSAGCQEFNRGCKNCPQIKGTLNPNLAEQQFIWKNKAFSNIHNLTITTPSVWLGKLSESSPLLSRFPHKVIQNCTNDKVFKLLDKSACRAVLGVDTNKTTLLFVADSVTNKRKGFNYLKEAFDRLPIDQFQLVAIGEMADIANEINFIKLGKIQDERLLAIAYNSADLFVIPSIEDNLPNTMLESLLCGVPIIGFNIGGVPDVVVEEETGILANEISGEGLTSAILKFVACQKKFDRNKISQKANTQFSRRKKAESFKVLYNELISPK